MILNGFLFGVGLIIAYVVLVLICGTAATAFDWLIEQYERWRRRR